MIYRAYLNRTSSFAKFPVFKLFARVSFDKYSIAKVIRSGRAIASDHSMAKTKNIGSNLLTESALLPSDLTLATHKLYFFCQRIQSITFCLDDTMLICYETQ